MRTKREHIFTFRMSTAERRAFDRVSKHYGINVTNVIRLLIRRECGELNKAEGKRQKAGGSK